MKQLTLLAALLITLNLYSQPGALDASFGKDGKVTTILKNREDVYLRAMDLQNDGKIVAAGDGTDDFFNRRIIMVQYNPVLEMANHGQEWCMYKRMERLF
jgi:hypothetical protein